MDRRVDKSVDKIEIALLGAPIVLWNGQAVAFRTRKALALLAYLVVENKTFSRETLAQFFWTESDAAHARQMLRTTLAHLKNAFAESGEIFLAERDEIAIHPRVSVELDARVLEHAARRDAKISEDELARAAKLVRGEFLQNVLLHDAPAFDDWVREQRERTHQQFSRVLETLAGAQTARGDLRAALATAERWRTHDPLDEAAARQAMQLHSALNERTAALRVFEQLRAALKRELGAAPLPETLALVAQWQNIPPPAPRTVSAPSPQQFIASMPLVGRAHEFARLTNAWQRVLQGEPQVFVITGEAGIGKTRLATEFARYLAAGGADVLQGRAFETGGRLPYQPLIDALRPRVERENAPDDLLSDVWLAELARLLPELRERYPDLVLAQEDAPTRLFESLARLSLAFARRAPMLWSVDDAQWADTASLDAMQYLLKRWRESNAHSALLFTLRAESAASFSSWFAEASRSANVTRISLTALTQENTLQLMQALTGADAAPRAFSEWLFAETNGQPFFMMETLKALLERGAVQAVRGGRDAWVLALPATEDAFRETTMPSGVQDIVRARFERLAFPASDLMLAAAVVGQQADFEMLCAVANVDEDAALRALDELLASGMLRQVRQANTSTIAVGHDKIRDVVYATLSDARRRVLHRRAFEWLTAHGAPPAARAHHALAANLVGHAFHALLAAGEDALKIFAVRDAVAFYERARQLSDDILIEPALYLQLGRAYELLSESDKAREIFAALLQLARAANEPRAEVAALNRLAMLSSQATDYARANALLHDAQRAAEQHGDRNGLAETEWTLAQLGIYNLDLQSARDHAAHALELAQANENAELTARSWNALAFAEKGLGEMENALLHARAASAYFARVGNLALQADSDMLVAATLMDDGAFDEGLAIASGALALCEKIENGWGIANCLVHIMRAELERGEWDRALASGERGLHAAGNTPFVPDFIELLIGNLYRARGEWERALEQHQRVLERAANANYLPKYLAMIWAELAADCVARGAFDEALPYARRAVAHRGYDVLPVGHGLVAETIALTRAGEYETAFADVERFGARLGKYRRHRISYERARAVLAHARGDVENARTHLASAATLAREIGIPREIKEIERMEYTLTL